MLISGEARNFAFLGDGTFITHEGFGVFLGIGSATGSGFGWPDWMPIKITQIGIEWEDIQANPADFTITLSATVSSIKGCEALEFSGTIEGLKIDVGLLLEGKFPIVDIASIGVGVKGNLFGGTINAQLIGGILKVDALGNMIDPTDSTTPVEDRIFFIGIQGGFEFAGMGLTIRFALSELGPLGVFINASIPGGVVLVPQIGLALNDFSAGVEFFQSLPSIDDPFDLRRPEFDLPTDVTPELWLSQVKQQVVTQYNLVKNSPGLNGFFAAFTSPMTITGSAKIFTLYTSMQVFNGQVTIRLSTDGKILIIGKLNFANDNISIAGRLYADLSKIAAGEATVLFLAEIPEQVDLLTIYGKLKMGFRNVLGEEIEVQILDSATGIPIADLAGPQNEGSIGIGTINGRGYIDVQFGVLTGYELNADSVLDLAPEFEAVLGNDSYIIPDVTQAPVQLNDTTFRYWISGTYVSTDPITLTFTKDSWFAVDQISGEEILNSETTVNVLDFSTVNTRYVDVTYYASIGGELDLNTIDGDEFSLSGPGAAGVSLAGELPTQIGDTDTFRYYFTGDFIAGDVVVDFAEGTWSDDSGDNSAQTQGFIVVMPEVDIAGPFSGSSIDVTAINSQEHNNKKYIDIVFTPTPGSMLDYESIMDPGAEFTLTVGNDDFTLDTTPIAMIVTISEQGILVTTPLGAQDIDSITEAGITRFRYLIDDVNFEYSPDTVEVAFVADSWSDAGGSKGQAKTVNLRVEGPTADLAGPFNGGSIDYSEINERMYIDVTFAPTIGNTLNVGSITSGGHKFTLSGPGVDNVIITPTETPSQLDGGNTFRYDLTNVLPDGFLVGEVIVTFQAGAWQDGEFSNIQEVEVFTVQGPTADLEDPANGTYIGVNSFNNRGWIDVPIYVPAGHTINMDSVTDIDAEFTLGGDGTANIQIDDTQAPILIDADTNTFRYWITGIFEAGDVAVTFLAGTWSTTDGDGASHDNTYQATTTLFSNGSTPLNITYVDVVFRSTSGNSLDISSVIDGDNEFDFDGSGADDIDFLAGQAPTQMYGTMTFRYYLVGSFTPGEVLVKFIGNSWSDTAGDGSTIDNLAETEDFTIFELGADLVDPVDGNVANLSELNDIQRKYIDISFSTYSDIALDISSITDTDPEFNLSGPGIGNVELDGTVELIDASTNTFRYHFTGNFDTGRVNLEFIEGSWQDTEGNLGAAETEIFAVVEPATTTETTRVFFIELSGGLQLRDPLGFASDPLLHIRGKVVLEIDYQRAIFTLDLSGTVEIYKIGNVASGAGRFVLDGSQGLSRVPQFWGVLKFQTNFDFLTPYGIYLYGTAMLQINATEYTKIETLTLQGVPGDIIFGITNPGLVLTLQGELPDGMFQDNPLSANWITEFDNANYTLSDPDNAVIAEVVENTRWRVTDGNKQYFIEKNGNIFNIHGEERTYELGPYMFSVEIAGMLAVRPAGINLFEMSGGFYLSLGVERFEIFAMAELSFFGITYSQSRGLLVVVTGLGQNDPYPGVAGYFEIGMGASLEDLGLPVDLNPNIFRASGKISVVFNTTLQDQIFTVPDSFLPLLEPGDPTSIEIYKAAPLANGSPDLNTPQGEVYIKAIVEAELVLLDVIRLTGFLGISAGVGQQGVSIGIEGVVSTEIDFLGALSGTLFFEVFIGSNPGIVGRVHLVLASEGIIPGISLHGEFILEFSTYGDTYTAYTFGINPDGTLKRDVYDVDQDGVTDELLLEDSEIASGLKLYMAGYLDIAGILRLNGKFTFTIDPDEGVLDIFVQASIALDPLGAFDVVGWLHVDGAGVIALIDINLDLGFGGDAGLKFEASARLQINTTNSIMSIEVSGTDPETPPDGSGQTYDIQPGFRLYIDGTIEFLGFAKGTGYADIQITAEGIQVQFGVDFFLWGLSFGAHGGAGIYAGNDPGLALYLNVYVIADAEVFDIEASGMLKINTCDYTARMGIDASSFYLALYGHVEILEVLRFNAGFTIQVGGSLGPGEWKFTFNAGIDFFGLVTLQGHGFLDSRGNFDINLDGYMQLGPSGFCIKGTFHFRIYCTSTDDGTGNLLYSLGLELGASVRAEVFGITLAGIGLNGSISVSGYGRQPIKMAITVKIKILFFTIKKTARFNIGYLTLPKPIYLGGYENYINEDYNQRTWDPDVGGDLYLNMGDRRFYRYMVEDQSDALTEWDEAFIIEQVDGDENGGTIKVTSFGRTRIYQNTTSLYADAGDGDDFIYVMDSVKIPVYLNGGAGEDVLIHRGSGTAQIYGGDGNDYIESSGTGTVELYGGGGGDYILYSGPSSVLIYGGDGDDRIFGGPGNDTIYGEAGSDEIEGRGGVDTVYGGTGSDLIKLSFDSLGSYVYGETDTSTGTDYDYLVVTATPTDDNILITKSASNQLVVESVGVGLIDTNSIEDLTIDAGCGADTITVVDLIGTPAKKITVNMGKLIVVTGTTTVIEDLDNDPSTTDDQIPMTVPVLSIYDDGAADTLFIDGYSGPDSFIASSVTPNPTTNRMKEISIVRQDVNDFLIQNSVRAEGDTVIVDAKEGDNLLDFSGLGDDDDEDEIVFPDLIAVELIAGSGNDEMIGSPFNDIIESADGDDRVTGGYGWDIFIDTGGYDTLIEHQDRDMSLFDDKFVTGTILSDDGGIFLKEAPNDVSVLAEQVDEDDPDFKHPHTGDHYAAGAIVEDLDYMFEEAVLVGGSSNNVIVVSDTDDTIYVGSTTLSVAAWTGIVTLNNRDSNNLWEYYIINTKGITGARITINGSYLESGSDQLIVNGTNQGDVFTLNATGSGGFRTGIIVAGDLASPDREIITFRGVERVAINSRAGDDRILSNDSVVVTVINMGSGDDEIVIGTVPVIPDTGNRTLEYPDGVPVVDTENMTNGNSVPMFVLGEGQNDRFEVNHNVARLYLHGGAGNDRFLLKTFLVLRDNPNDHEEITNLMSVFGGAGMNRYDYLQNAPVEINGGPGIDTVVVIGTPLGDIFVVTDTYIAGAGRITTFRNIEVVEVDAGGGDDQIYVLSTSEEFETTVVGGSGDDIIHLGGEHPPIVFDPPPFIYTPPAFTVELPPEVVYDTYSLNLNGFKFDVDYFRFWWSFGGNIDALVQDMANRFVAVWQSIFPHFRVDNINFSGVTWRFKYDHFWWWFFSPKIEITVATFNINFSIGHLEAREKVVQPPPVIVDPPPFLFKAPGVFDISDIRGKLTIQGGEQYETNGDRVIVHNQEGSSAAGIFTNRISPRMIHIGEDQTSNFIFVQDVDLETNELLYDTYQTVEGLELPTGVGLDTVWYSGVRIEAIEDVELRLADDNDDFTVAEAEYRSYDGSSDNITMGQVLEDVSLTIVAGGGDDIVNVKQIGAETRIMGGAGDDTVYVNDNNRLNGINARLLFDGDAHIDELLADVLAAEYADILDNVPMVFINTDPEDGGLSYQDPSGEIIYYKLPEQAPIIEDDGTGKLLIRVVVLNDEGEVIEDRVQEKGVQELGVQMNGVQKTVNGVPIFLDENGNETTDDTGTPVIVASPTGQPVYMEQNGSMTFTDTGIPIILTDPDGLPVYLDEMGRKTFTPTERISFVSDFVNGSLLYIDSDGVKVNTPTGTPSLIAVNRNEAIPFKRAVEVYESIPGTDYLYVNNSADDSDVHSILDTYELPVITYDENGQIIYNQGSDNPAAKVFFGGEQKRHPETGELMFYDDSAQWDPYTDEWYQAGDPVRDPFTGSIVYDPFGRAVTHKTDDPRIHIVGEHVLHFKDEIQRYLGGEQVYDEQGEPVYNYDGSPFLHLAGQAKIHNRREPVLDENNINMQYSGGEPKYYYGDETVQVGEPIVDYNGNLMLNEDGFVILHTNDSITDHYGRAILHRRGEPVYELTPGADPNLLQSWAQATYNAGDLMYYLGNEPWRYFGGEDAFYTSAEPVEAAQSFFRIRVIGQPDFAMPGQVFYNNLDSVTITLGDGDDAVTIVNTHTENTEVYTGAGDDIINVQTIDGDTTVYAQDADDIVNVGSFAGLWETEDSTYEFLNVNGTVDGIGALLTIHGGNQNDILIVDDTGDSNDNTGDLTSNAITGLDMSNGITYNTLEVVEINLGLGNDMFDVYSTHTRADGFQTWTMVNTGPGDDIVTVSLEETVDGAFALNTQSGNDEVYASSSTLPLVIFGGQGDDLIDSGQANDIIFGDRGRVDYSNENGRIVTRLGSEREVIIGQVDSAVNNNGTADLTGSSISTYGTEIEVTDLPTGYAELIGLNVQITKYIGMGQELLILSNTVDTLTLSGNWDPVPVLGRFGIHILPEHQTDGVVREPELILPVDVEIGGSDIIMGNGGKDIIAGGMDDDVLIGGIDDDTLDGNEDDDLIFGDNAQFGFTAQLAETTTSTSPRYRALIGEAIYGETGGYDGIALVDMANQYSRPGGGPKWADWIIIPGADTEGDDYIAGGSGSDTIFGQLGNDIIQGDGSIAGKLEGNGVLAYRDSNGLLVVVPSFEATSDGDDYIEGNAGADVIFGNLGQDDIIGGSSELFGYNSQPQRQDGSDIIFGGAGTDIARNDLGDETETGHARDADMILGDNGNIFRLVGINGADSGAFLTFYYDNYSAALRIIPRAAELLDYHPGGLDYNPALSPHPAANDIGAADEIHGESGDDFIYGMVGSDILFGDGQDDDLIGGYGSDWISGGTGRDGVLGDDGRIYTSRNSALGEPLYGIAGLTELNKEISTPGNIQQATINVSGELKKTVNIMPFKLGDPEDLDYAHNLFEPANADDIIYGGWGGDFLHGCDGDDAVSGAEALPVFYDVPANNGNILRFGEERDGEFAAYNEYHPRQKVRVNDSGVFTGNTSGSEFLLNFDHQEGHLDEYLSEVPTDGDDVIFGDLGNDWLVGGTGKDHLYGGYGSDLLNADDNHDSTNNDDGVLTVEDLANDAPDTHPSYEDIAYGGAGRDVLIANTGGDRLIDWAGEFNSYIVPHAPFGAFTISRCLQPGLMRYLYDLSASDGADPTRAGDTGADAARNGEPEGETGLANQRDRDWHDQTGAPDDPQPGNIPGGPRDVLRSATFNSGSMALDAFATDSGIWDVTGGKLSVSAESIGQDAVSLFHVDQMLPSYYEIVASISADKPTGGWKSDAYIIFDYYSPTDFKFAGVNISINKMQMGHRNASGWVVDVQKPCKLKPNMTYDVLIAVNGTVVTMLVDGREVFSHVYEPRMIDGYAYGLNTGMIGMGSENSRGSFDNVTVQRIPPEITFQDNENFSDGIASLFTDQMSGQWQVTSEQYYAAPDAGGEPAVSLMDLGLSDGLQLNSILELQATVNTQGTAGIVFDYYSASDFKFVAINADSNELIVGHYTAKHGWQYDASVQMNIRAGKDYDLAVSLKGNTVSVSLGGQVVLGCVFNAVAVDGSFGLIADSQSCFDDVGVKTDDPAFGDQGSELTSSTGPVSEDQLPPVELQTDIPAPLSKKPAKR
ncbi:MAG: hypothetical protein ACYS1A_13895 [Planctomycetota bacterium]